MGKLNGKWASSSAVSKLSCRPKNVYSLKKKKKTHFKMQIIRKKMSSIHIIGKVHTEVLLCCPLPWRFCWTPLHGRSVTDSGLLLGLQGVRNETRGSSGTPGGRAQTVPGGRGTPGSRWEEGGDTESWTAKMSLTIHVPVAQQRAGGFRRGVAPGTRSRKM